MANTIAKKFHALTVQLFVFLFFDCFFGRRKRKQCAGFSILGMGNSNSGVLGFFWQLF